MINRTVSRLFGANVVARARLLDHPPEWHPVSGGGLNPLNEVWLARPVEKTSGRQIKHLVACSTCVSRGREPTSEMIPNVAFGTMHYSSRAPSMITAGFPQEFFEPHTRRNYSSGKQT